MTLLSLLNRREKRKKAGAIKGRRREPAKISESLEGFSKSIFLFFCYFFKDMFWGPLGVYKRILNKKDFWVRTLKHSVQERPSLFSFSHLPKNSAFKLLWRETHFHNFDEVSNQNQISHMTLLYQYLICKRESIFVRT